MTSAPFTSPIRNNNYRIGTDTLEDGRVRAQARGRKTNRKTYPAGTTPEAAALDLAQKIEGETRHVEVRNLVDMPSVGKADWAIYTNHAAAVSAPEVPADQASGDLLAALELPENRAKLNDAISSMAEEVIDGSITRGDGYNWEAVLFFFGRGTQEPGAFVFKLMDAMAAADSGNRAKLVQAFPAIGIPFQFAKNEHGGLDAISYVANMEANRGGHIGIKTLRQVRANLAEWAR